jgi:two-component system cell cycle sensor histidine kinase/response regulator CckA
LTPQSRQELTQTLFEESGDALFLFDPDTDQVLHVNPMALRLCGFTRQELLRTPASQLYRSETPGDVERLRRAFADSGIFHAADGFLLRSTKPAGWIPVELTVSRLQVQPKPLGLITARDLRAQRETYSQLQKKEADLQRVLASVPCCLWSVEFDSQGRPAHTYHSAGVEKITGRWPEFYTHDPEAWISTVHSLDRTHILEAYRQLQKGGENSAELEYRVVWPDGTDHWVRNRVIATRDPRGLGVRLDGVMTDIEERKRAEAALRNREIQYLSLAENLEQCVFLKDRELRYRAVNQRFGQALGCAVADILGKTDSELYPPHLAVKYQADDQRVLREGRRLEREEQNFVNAQLRTVHVVKTPVRDEQGEITGVLGIFWDVTDQRLLEAKVRHVQKMEAIGQLASGVAHDFNNLLTVILGNVSLLRAGRAPGEIDEELLNTTEKAALRAAELTNKLLGFARRTTLRLVETNLNTCVEETVMILRRTIDPAIRIEVNLAPQLWRIEADPSQMNQVLMNLCLNARDAMPTGGRLRLETSNGVLDEDYARQHLEARPGEFVRLRVEDTGHGIPPEVRQRIFEPFFTTKEPGKGTGLGLAMVFGIVKQHQGWIDCYSELDRGTRFDVYLPRYHRPEESAPRTAAAQLPAQGHETILLVDDEAMIRTLGQNILQSYGYRVLVAEDGAKAVEIYRRDPQQIDLVLLDVTMPGLSGRDAYEQMMQFNPEVRVLFASGYSAEEIAQWPGDHVQGFVRKPYLPEELAQAVRARLEKPRSRAQEEGSGI